MHKRVTVNPYQGEMLVPSKHWVRKIAKLEEEHGRAICNAMDMIMPALAIAMYENTQVRWEGLMRWKQTLKEVIEECAADDDLTVYQVLERETGMELQIGDGKSYKDTVFADAKNFEKNMNDNNPVKWVRFYQKKIQWSTATVMAACLVACNRQFRWAAEGNLDKVRDATEFILDWYKRKTKPIALEFEKVTGHKTSELFDGVRR